MPSSTPRPARRGRLGWVAAAAVAALCLGPVAACSDDGEGPGRPPADIAYDGAFDNRLVRSLHEYDDQRVRLTGEVRRVVSSYAFTLGEPDVDPVLVVAPDGIRVQPGDVVEVTGRIHRQLDLGTVEKQVGTDIDDGALADWGKEPYLVAGSIDRR